MTEDEYQHACAEIARGRGMHVFDPWREPGKFGAWSAYWKRHGIHRVMVRCVMTNSWPSEKVATPAQWPREFDQRNCDMQADMHAAGMWIENVKQMARRGALPIGVYSKLKEGGIDLPPIDADVLEARERIKNGFELLRQGRHDDAKRAVMQSGGYKKPVERYSGKFWYEDI